MKVSRKSWHYKISNFGSYYEKSYDSLCNYFWRLVSKVLLGIILTVFCSAILWSYFTSPIFIAITILILSLISCIVLPIIAIAYLRDKLPEIPYENIFIEYIKAKKRKLCPFIEYVN